jgi:hypothetical protein
MLCLLSLSTRFLCRRGLLFVVRSLFSVGPWGSVRGVRSVHRLGFWQSFDPIYTSLHTSLIVRHFPSVSSFGVFSRQGRGYVSKSELKRVKKKARTMYIDALYRGVGQKFSTTEITRARSSDTSRTTAKTKGKQRQAKTSKTKTNKGNGTRKRSTEPKTNKNQEITQARAQFPHTRSKTITNTKDLHRSSSLQNTIECCLRW